MAFWRRPHWLTTAVCTLAVFMAWSLWQNRYDDAAETEKRGPLDAVVSLHVDDRPLRDVLDEIGETHHLQVGIDNATLYDLYMNREMLVSLHAERVSLRLLLEMLLEEADSRLVAGQRDDGVWVTERNVWRNTLGNYSTRVYRLDSLLPGDGSFDEAEVAYLLQACVGLETWSTRVSPGSGGGLGKIRTTPGAVVVQQLPESHREIEALLEALAEARRRSSRELLTPLAPAPLAHVNVSTRLYPLGETIQDALNPVEVLEVIRSRVSPTGIGRISSFPDGVCLDGVFVARQADDTHEVIERALAELRHVLDPERFPSLPETAEEIAQRRVEQVLQEETRLDFGETTLEKAAEFIAKKHHLDVQLHKFDLDFMGIGRDTPVSFVPQTLPLKTALQLALRDLDMEYMIRGETVYFTSKIYCQWLDTRFYRAPMNTQARVGRQWVDVVSGALALPHSGPPPTYEPIQVYGDFFVTTQEEHVHESISLLLTALETAMTRDPRDVAPVDVFPVAGELQARARAKLDEPTSINVENEPWRNVLRRLANLHDEPILVDVPACDAMGVDPDSPVELSVENVPLKDVLRQIAGKHGLTFLVEEGVIEITTPDRAGTRLPLRLYPAADLLARQPDDSPQNTTLVDALRDAASRDNWSDRGGPYFMDELGGALVIRATYDIHDKIEQKLVSLREPFP